MELGSIILFILGAALLILMLVLLKRLPAGKNDSASQEDLSKLQEERLSLKKDLEFANNRIEKSLVEFEKQRLKEESLNHEILQLKLQLSERNSAYKNLEEKLNSQAEEMEKLQEKFTKEFKLIANSVLKENSQEFSKLHQKELNEILSPLQLKLKSFQESIHNKYIDETKERSSLKQEIKNLVELNNTLNDQAQNLTNALKGDNKKQGNWGEMVLERILESSGLIKGQEYETQQTDKNADNQTIKPDVIIRLPDEKHIIVDSKVSLLAYENYTSAEEENDKEAALKAHINSVKNHVKILSEKNYQSGIGFNSPDFVLLFIPIESSFSLAVQGDPNLYAYAWDNKVVIVSPTTLLATLRTIASVWKHEKQTKNAIEIADKAGKLYDKFKGFVDDMEKIERGINSAKTAYDDAFNKLKSGTGNLIRRAEHIKTLGAKTSKSLPNELIEESIDEE